MTSLSSPIDALREPLIDGVVKKLQLSVVSALTADRISTFARESALLKLRLIDRHDLKAIPTIMQGQGVLLLCSKPRPPATRVLGGRLSHLNIARWIEMIGTIMNASKA